MQHTGIIKSIRPVGRTINGNVIREVTFDDGAVFRTAPDSMCSMVIENSEYRDVLVSVALSRGRICSVELGGA